MNCSRCKQQIETGRTQQRLCRACHAEYMRTWRRSQTLEAKLNAFLSRNRTFKCQSCGIKSATVRKLISGPEQLCLEYQCQRCDQTTTHSVEDGDIA